jgi:hypothetical protein
MSSRKLIISEKDFKCRLSKKFIEIMDSERGMQLKLANSIGKKSNYFSAVKRGNPVNAMHLKAVELVCGPEKVLEMLTISESDKKNAGVIDLASCSDIIKEFQQKELIRELNLNALHLEQIKPEAIKEINDYIKFKIQSIETSVSGETPVEDARKKRANGE